MNKPTMSDLIAVLADDAQMSKKKRAELVAMAESVAADHTSSEESAREQGIADMKRMCDLADENVRLTSREAKGEAKPVAHFIETSPGNWDQAAALYAGQPGVVPLYTHPAAQEAAKPVERARGGAEPDPKLCDFYRVTSWRDLVAAQEEHVLKLQDAARRNVKPWDDTFPPTLLPKYLRETGLIDADKVSAYEVAAPSIEYWTAVKKGITAESIAEDHRAAGVTDTTVTRLYAAQPKREQAVGDGVVACTSFWANAPRYNLFDLNSEAVAYRYRHPSEPGSWCVFQSKARSKALADSGMVVEPLYTTPRPAVATPAEVTEGVANVIEWHERERDTQRKLGHDCQAEMHDCYADMVRALAAHPHTDHRVGVRNMVPDGWEIDEDGRGFVRIKSQTNELHIVYMPTPSAQATTMLRDLACAMLAAAPEMPHD